jgi:hypothetical protein
MPTLSHNTINTTSGSPAERFAQVPRTAWIPRITSIAKTRLDLSGLVPSRSCPVDPVAWKVPPPLQVIRRALTRQAMCCEGSGSSRTVLCTLLLLCLLPSSATALKAQD